MSKVHSAYAYIISVQSQSLFEAICTILEVNVGFVEKDFG